MNIHYHEKFIIVPNNANNVVGLVEIHSSLPLSLSLSTCYEKFIFVRTGNYCLFDESLFPPTSHEKFFLVPNDAVGLMEINPPIKETSVVGILLWRDISNGLLVIYVDVIVRLVFG